MYELFKTLFCMAITATIMVPGFYLLLRGNYKVGKKVWDKTGLERAGFTIFMILEIWTTLALGSFAVWFFLLIRG